MKYIIGQSSYTALFYTHFRYVLQKPATVISTSFNTETLFSSIWILSFNNMTYSAPNRVTLPEFNSGANVVEYLPIWHYHSSLFGESDILLHHLCHKCTSKKTPLHL